MHADPKGLPRQKRVPLFLYNPTAQVAPLRSGTGDAVSAGDSRCMLADPKGLPRQKRVPLFLYNPAAQAGVSS